MKLLSENYIFICDFERALHIFFLIVLSIVTMLPLFIFAHKCIQKSGRNYS